jgi:hypothetical protein
MWRASAEVNFTGPSNAVRKAGFYSQQVTQQLVGGLGAIPEGVLLLSAGV